MEFPVKNDPLEKAGLIYNPKPLSGGLCPEPTFSPSNALKAAPARTPVMDVPGYEKLQNVLERAYAQAAVGKGKERHANGEPFHEQVMQTGAHRFGTGALLFQAFKKSEESQRLPLDRAINELLGAINYLAGAVIALESKAADLDARAKK